VLCTVVIINLFYFHQHKLLMVRSADVFQSSVHAPITCRSPRQKLHQLPHRKYLATWCQARGSWKSKYKRTITKYRNPSPACEFTPHAKEFYLFLWGGQQPQECKEFNRLFNLQTALYQTWSNPVARACSLCGLPCLGIELRLASYNVYCSKRGTDLQLRVGMIPTQGISSSSNYVSA
jgi:hypothetical protein